MERDGIEAMDKEQKKPEEKEEKEVQQELADIEQEEMEDGEGALIEELAQTKKMYEESVDQMKRLAAEYDNFRKRSIKERSQLKLDTLADTVLAILPVVDNLQRALDNAQGDESPLAMGVQMVMRQLQDTLSKLGVQEIESVGTQFDPALHNAVMHIEDEKKGDNVIVEELQKGYMVEDKVIRHSMVKVAN